MKILIDSFDDETENKIKIILSQCKCDDQKLDDWEASENR